MNRAILVLMALSLFLFPGELSAEPRYPESSEYQLARNVEPEFIYLDQLVDEIIHRKGPVIIDVRSHEEYEWSHIKGAISIPLGEIDLRPGEIPKDRLVVFY